MEKETKDVLFEDEQKAEISKNSPSSQHRCFRLVLPGWHTAERKANPFFPLLGLQVPGTYILPSCRDFDPWRLFRCLTNQECQSRLLCLRGATEAGWAGGSVWWHPPGGSWEGWEAPADSIRITKPLVPTLPPFAGMFCASSPASPVANLNPISPFFLW